VDSWIYPSLAPFLFDDRKLGRVRLVSIRRIEAAADDAVPHMGSVAEGGFR
jgi:hypothetical protein